MDKFMKALDFDSDTLENAKKDANFVLQRLLGNMVEKGSTNGSLTLKIDVSFAQEYIPNYDPKIDGESRKINKPSFKHKVTSTVQIKDEKVGIMSTEMELAFDESSGEYVLQPVADTAQKSIFDSDFKDNMQPEDDVIDADYTETDLDEQEETEDVTDEILGDGEEPTDGYDYDDPEDEE